MKRHTNTILNNLRPGDRFQFHTDKPDVSHEFIGLKKNGRGKYNKIKTGTGKHAWWFNRSKPGLTPVKFIRHTQLLPGDECFIYELNEGDVFHRPGDPKYREMRRGKDRPDKQVNVRYVGQAVWLHTSPLTTGIFVRRASLKTKPDVPQKTTE